MQGSFAPGVEADSPSANHFTALHPGVPAVGRTAAIERQHRANGLSVAPLYHN